jgi:Zn-dependent peptidase ImmA (M78 family)
MASSNPGKLAARMRLAREAFDLAPERVTEHLGFAPNSILQFERGERRPSSDELSRMSVLYGRDPDEFFAVDFDPSIPLPTMARDLAEAIGHAEVAAVRDRLRLGLGDAPLFNLLELLLQQGLNASVDGMPKGVNGMVSLEPTDHPMLAVDSRGSEARQRSRLAHAYGHLLMDGDELFHLCLLNNRQEMRELRADAFAAAFLMPARGVESFMTQMRSPRGSSPAIGAEDVVRLAAHFVVSPEVALTRLLRLSYLTSEEESALRSSVEEPDDPHAPYQPVRPRLLVAFVESVRDGRRRLEEVRGVLRRMNIPVEEFEAAAAAMGVQLPAADLRDKENWWG